jgi:hypothetical protein
MLASPLTGAQLQDIELTMVNQWIFESFQNLSKPVTSGHNGRFPVYINATLD